MLEVPFFSKFQDVESSREPVDFTKQAEETSENHWANADQIEMYLK